MENREKVSEKLQKTKPGKYGIKYKTGNILRIIMKKKEKG